MGKVVVCVVGSGAPNLSAIIDTVLSMGEAHPVDVLPNTLSCTTQPIESLPQVAKEQRAWPRPANTRLPKTNMYAVHKKRL